MPSPLIRRLSDTGYPRLDAESLDGFLAATQDVAVLFVTGDPAKQSDANDVAVILPELVARFQNRLVPAIMERSAEGLMAERYGADVKPALVFLHHGALLGTIVRVRDWDDYLERIRAMLAKTETAALN